MSDIAKAACREDEANSPGGLSAQLPRRPPPGFLGSNSDIEATLWGLLLGGLAPGCRWEAVISQRGRFLVGSWESLAVGTGPLSSLGLQLRDL